MAYVNGKIIFSKLKGFPILDDNSKIETLCFIEGAKEIVSLIGEFFLLCAENVITISFINLFSGEFGPLFIPVVQDMNGNVEVILPAAVVCSTKCVDCKYIVV